MRLFHNANGASRVIYSCIACAAMLALSGCGDNAEQSLNGGVTPTDAKALDEAAAKLDAENQVPAPVLGQAPTPPQATSQTVPTPSAPDTPKIAGAPKLPKP